MLCGAWASVFMYEGPDFSWCILVPVSFPFASSNVNSYFDSLSSCSPSPFFFPSLLCFFSFLPELFDKSWLRNARIARTMEAVKKMKKQKSYQIRPLFLLSQIYLSVHTIVWPPLCININFWHITYVFFSFSESYMCWFKAKLCQSLFCWNKFL